MTSEKIIFLDAENTGLSPFAQALFIKKIKGYKSIDLKVLSRGNVVLFPEPVNQKLKEVAKDFGINLEHHSARQIDSGDFQGALILSMDTDSKTRIYRRNADAANVYTLKEYLGEIGDIKLPIGGTLEEYAEVCRSLDILLDKLLDKIRAEADS